ncbi:MAG TPA: hypothetical protein VNN74_08105 [Candidatus Micrarchaeia archaeon]|nr:hypothetical protein [Candidatus Micrarchaeia archaeon]
MAAVLMDPGTVEVGVPERTRTRSQRLRGHRTVPDRGPGSIEADPAPAVPL